MELVGKGRRGGAAIFKEQIMRSINVQDLINQASKQGLFPAYHLPYDPGKDGGLAESPMGFVCARELADSRNWLKPKRVGENILLRALVPASPAAGGTTIKERQQHKKDTLL